MLRFIFSLILFSAFTDHAYSCTCEKKFINPELISYSIIALYDDFKECAQTVKSSTVTIKFEIDGAIAVTKTKPKAIAACVRKKLQGIHTKGIADNSTKAVLTFNPKSALREFSVSVDYRLYSEKLTYEFSNTVTNTKINGFQFGSIGISLTKTGKPAIEFSVPKNVVGNVLVVRGCRTDERISSTLRGQFITGTIEQARWCMKDPGKTKQAVCTPSYLDCISTGCIDIPVKVTDLKGTVPLDKSFDLSENFYDFVGFVADQRIASNILSPEKIAQAETPGAVKKPPVCDCEVELFPPQELAKQSCH